ncbi:hypothetical protein K8353_39055, partial [Burkholderia contaminans]|nr:hypothetical protein [Burkholderia contaminans]
DDLGSATPLTEIVRLEVKLNMTTLVVRRWTAVCLNTLKSAVTQATLRGAQGTVAAISPADSRK